MASNPGHLVVAGHICLDLIPPIGARAESLGEVLRAGALVHVGAIQVSTGGAVGNTGLAVHKLGVPVRLAGKVGADAFGRMVLDLLRAQDPELARAMAVDPHGATSYTVVLNPPGLDRVFLHHPGANDTFVAGDVADACLEGARLLHFGYPPLMRRLYERDGAELVRLFAAARARGVTTSLDMAMPDPASDAGRVDWRAWMRHVLPHVDLFLPSFDELARMLGHGCTEPDAATLRRLADETLAMGAVAVAIKLGDRGLYLRTGPDVSRLGCDAVAWAGRERLATCCEVAVGGTTGAGDCTIAGFLVELAAGGTPESALAFATAVGACSVERPDATSAVPHADAVRARLRNGWRRHPPSPALGSWQPTSTSGVYQPN
ncbi:MAG: carbohydrate kinase family protein [Candidatus Sumerlaeia bacterium]|nr:carbohydrate kinase family protein [Candidatus Sumerlaeia bacterium]